MGKQTGEEVELRQYLLGELGEQERWAVEERLFLDGEYLLQLQALEDDLIDAYVYGNLPPDERVRVEAELLSRPGRREDLKFAHALKDLLVSAVDEPALSDAVVKGPAPQVPWYTSLPFLPLFVRRHPVAAFSLAAAFVILTLLVWQISQAERSGRSTPLVRAPAPEQGAPPPQQSPQEQANRGGSPDEHPAEQPGPPQNSGERDANTTASQRPQQQPPPRRSPPPRSGAQRSSLAITALLLPTSAVREGDPNPVVRFSSEVGTVNLRLPLLGEDDTYSSYRATLRAGGQPVRSWSKLKSAGTQSERFVQVPVPARSLRGRGYELTLAGVAGNGRAEALRTYSFDVVVD